MSEVQQPAQPSPAPAAAPAAPEAPKPSGLEKVYQDFNIEDTASGFQQPSPQPAAQPAAPQPPKVPDPFSPEFQSYQAELAKGLTVLNQGVSELKQQQSQLQRELQRERTEADIKRAVGAIAEKSGVDYEIAEVAFEAKARKDPKLLAIWNNRSKNPKALTAAIEALSGEFKDRFAVRQDPQLVENQRAVKASQQQMATTKAESPNDELANMSPAERQALIRRKFLQGR